mmetsp:Transcript_23303/g.66295  ORF Transcript_23303/g.66295 Transcript_23303/m.66295 type:complete len:342 (-) Transcript_23303:12-1037(-)
MAAACGCRPAGCWPLHVLFLVAAAGLRQQSPMTAPPGWLPAGDAAAAAAPEAEGLRNGILVAVNVHEKPDVLMLQLANINAGLNNSFRPHVALSCNAMMHRNLSRAVLPPYAELNPEVIEKQRFHGTLLQGIVSNLRFLAARHHFSHALVLSSRSRIEQEITLDDVQNSIDTCSRFFRERCHDTRVCHMSKCHSTYARNAKLWEGFNHTLLAQHVSNNTGHNPQLLGAPHESLLLESGTVRKILRFLDEHPEIEQDLYERRQAVEEFALHTLAAFVGGGFGYMGAGRGGPYSFYKIAKVPREAWCFKAKDKMQREKNGKHTQKPLTAKVIGKALSRIFPHR